MLLALVVSANAPAQSVDPEARTEIPVPGGIAAIDRLVGPVDQDPESFVLSLNAQLLGTTNRDHDWRAVPRRRDLVRFLEVVDDLRRRFPGPITIGTGPTERRALEQLAGLLGFELARDRKRGWQLVPRNGGERDGDQAFRRHAAQALGLGLEELVTGLDDGGTATVTIPIDRVPAQLPPELWQRITGGPLGADALAVLARDQRLSLLLDGRSRLTVETRRAFDRMDTRRIYRDAPFPFRRYASALEVRDGRMVVPGGDAALPAWREMVGTSPDAPEPFLHRLIEERRARAAYLWHSFRFAPPPVVDYYLGGRGTAEGLHFVRKVFQRLDPSAGAAFDGSLAADFGLAAFARSVPIEHDGSRLHLPGGAGLWLAAIKGDLALASTDELQAVVRAGMAREVDDADFVLEVLLEKVDRPGPNLEVLPSLIRSVNLFWQHPSLYSPENVVLAARVSDVAMPALGLLDSIEIRAPEVARDYLLTVARLHRLELDWPQEQLVSAFQGGVEWLRAMGAAGRVDPAVLERHLVSWSRIHSRHAAAAAAAPEQLLWIAEVLRDLPAAPADMPGRGPLERAMVQALVPPVDPDFSWKGLSYGSDRSSLLAARMVESLQFFGIPSADQLASLLDTLNDLARGCRDEDLESARRAATTLRDRIAVLPIAGASSGIETKEVLRRIGNVERAEILALADEIIRLRKPRGLAGLAVRVEESSRYLAADLRPFLIAPAYVVVLATGRGSLLQDRDFVRRHRLAREGAAVDCAWSEAVVERSELADAGSWVCGHVGTVDGAIASFLFSGAELRATKGLDPERARAWYRHWAATRWHRLAPATTAALASAMELGRSLVDLGIREAARPGTGPHLDLVSGVVPFARLEAAAARPRSALVSPSEALTVGLAAIERGDDDPAIAEVGAASLAGARAAIGALGASWRERLSAAGPSTPMLNGKASPWLGEWPSYEAVALELFTDALVERELVDLHLLVLDYLGRHGLPGSVGADLMRHTMQDLVSSMELGHERDWESVLRRLLRLDDAYFEARMRECLRDGFYRLRDS